MVVEINEINQKECFVASRPKANLGRDRACY